MVLGFSSLGCLFYFISTIFMKEIPVKELESRVQKYVSKASGLIKVEPFYAASILSNIVRANPYCVEARQMLRKAQIRISGATKSSGIAGFFAKLSFGRVNEAAIKKNPEQALQKAEDQIDANFSNITAHKYTTFNTSHCFGRYRKTICLFVSPNGYDGEGNPCTNGFTPTSTPPNRSKISIFEGLYSTFSIQ